MNGGTSVIPNLDSIDEFRVLTTNFDPEYGNYNGGIVTAVTKGGTNEWHGDAFEFFRNTVLDARGYLDPSRSTFNQNQFGGTLGGPIRGDKTFIFADYQGTRTSEGVSTGNISVPTLAERNGIFGNLTGSVSGPHLASWLSQELGSTVTAGEPYTSEFPGGVIPQRAWSAPGKALLGYIPSLTKAVANTPPRTMRRRSATTRGRFESMETAVSVGSPRMSSLTTIASIVHIPALSPEPAFPASMRFSLGGHSGSPSATTSPWELRPSMNFTSDICATPTSSDNRRVAWASAWHHRVSSPGPALRALTSKLRNSRELRTSRFPRS